ncbi:YqaJ viral recombinase family protein [Mesorhizobium sp.]|uniref:YqaJ viral recombinase family nuclease n=1 Tax=Mesorhizobium sp. TaxID=1871066 RepID=UPI0025EC383A|nr:YqaJ viral recombinase family protein [Mesorhizobium sp.]
MIEIIHPADRAAWLAARQQDVTASVAAAVLGAHPYTTPYGLWAEKTGRLDPDAEETEAMERGNLLEPVAVTMVRKRHPDWTVIYKDDRAYYRDTERRIGATPDAFVEIPGRPGRGNMQIKTASEAAFRDFWQDPDTGDIIPPTWIAVQAITEAKLTGCAYAMVAVVVVTWRGNLRLHVVDVPLHEKLWIRLTAEVGRFWALVDSGGEPDVDWNRDGQVVLEVYQNSYLDRRDMSADHDLDVLVGKYKSLKEAEAQAKKQAEVLKPQIIYALGNSEAGYTAGWEITARTQQREAYEVRSSTMRPLRIKPRKAENATNF